jgi:hypothetical protein
MKVDVKKSHTRHNLRAKGRILKENIVLEKLLNMTFESLIIR